MERASSSLVTEGVERAVQLAKVAAGDKDVSVMGADLTRQCIAAGILDELAIDLVPIVLTDGVRQFDQRSSQTLELQRERVVDAPGVTHFSFAS